MQFKNVQNFYSRLLRSREIHKILAWPFFWLTLYLSSFIKIESVTAEILLILSFCGGWVVFAKSFIVKPNLVLRLGWGFDNKKNNCGCALCLSCYYDFPPWNKISETLACEEIRTTWETDKQFWTNLTPMYLLLLLLSVVSGSPYSAIIGGGDAYDKQHSFVVSIFL